MKKYGQDDSDAQCCVVGRIYPFHNAYRTTQEGYAKNGSRNKGDEALCLKIPNNSAQYYDGSKNGHYPHRCTHFLIPHVKRLSAIVAVSKKLCKERSLQDFVCPFSLLDMAANQDQTDRDFMDRAIALGERGRLRAPPNPWVGCVLVRDGQVVGEGFHSADGEPHAEVEALRQAGGQARGSTAYVSLEPCAHHGRTPPCSDALILAKVERVVVAVQDPDPRVCEHGIEKMRRAGVSVVVGVCAEKASHSLRSYLHQRRLGRPYCIIKAALSLDGRVAAADGSSQWISSAEARVDAHRLRAESQAILVGAGTALTDHPRLTVRDWTAAGVRQPLRVLLDASGKVPPEGPLFDTCLAPTLIATTHAAPKEWIERCMQKGAEVVVLPSAADGIGVDVQAVVTFLGSRGVLQLLVEGGSHIHSAFFRYGLVNEVTLYVGPLVLGERGLPFVQAIGVNSIGDAKRMKLMRNQAFGDTMRLDYVHAF